MKKAFHELCRQLANNLCKESKAFPELSIVSGFTGRFSLKVITILQMTAEKYIINELAMAYVLFKRN